MLIGTVHSVGYNAVADSTGLLHSCSCRCLPNLRNPAKFWENSNLLQVKFIQGLRSWCQSREHMQCDFLLVINSNFGCIFYRFRDIDA